LPTTSPGKKKKREKRARLIEADSPALAPAMSTAARTKKTAKRDMVALELVCGGTVV
jgi:hypothetical protein